MSSYREELVRRISRCNKVLHGLENYEPFRIVLDDFKQQLEYADANWHVTFDEKKLDELRVTKMAASSMVNCLDAYKRDLEVCVQKLAAFEHPELIQDSYVDKE